MNAAIQGHSEPSELFDFGQAIILEIIRLCELFDCAIHEILEPVPVTGDTPAN